MMIVERDGKFYRLETTEKEISELEFLKEKIKELEDKIAEISRQPSIISYPVICPCPNSPNTTPWTPTNPIYETEPYRITFTC
jgi:hypothetical protein